MTKLDWKDNRYGGGSSADLGHGLTLSVTHEAATKLPLGEPCYNVYVFGRKLKTRSASPQEAQERAERVALAWLAEMTAKLSGENPPPST